MLAVYIIKLIDVSRRSRKSKKYANYYFKFRCSLPPVSNITMSDNYRYRLNIIDTIWSSYRGSCRNILHTNLWTVKNITKCDFLIRKFLVSRIYWNTFNAPGKVDIINESAHLCFILSYNRQSTDISIDTVL